MLPRHYRRTYDFGDGRGKRSAMFARIVVVIVIVLFGWYLLGKLMPFFAGQTNRKSGVLLSISSNGGVQFSLQGNEWQAAVTNVKLYPGDKILTKTGGDAFLTFFDGTRVRLDAGTTIAVADSTMVIGGTSNTSIDLTEGRIWISSPTRSAFTGAITRTMTTGTYAADVPPGTEAILSKDALLVLRADGLGVHLGLTFDGSQHQTMVIGEGQALSLTAEALSAIKAGADPYTFRDPITTKMLQDDFLISSRQASILAALAIPASATADNNGTPDRALTVQSPENNVHVSTKTVTVAGRVGSLTAQVVVNGADVPIQDHVFSVDVSVSGAPSTVIRIEARDAQGIPLENVERTVFSDKTVTVEPVKIKSPVGSGETLTTAQTEIEITGEAPVRTAGIMVNDYKLQLFKPGDKTWSYLASTALDNLRIGENTFAIVALDADGSKSPARSITIVLQAPPTGGTGTTVRAIKQNTPLTPGVLSVDEPVAGTAAETQENEVVMAGKTSDDTASISINGYTLSLYQSGKTTWNYIASTALKTLRRGRNVYRIVARNADGEILDVLEYTMTYKP